MTFKLRRLADKKGPDEEDFNKLAASLDEFISRLFDPLKSGGRLRDVFLSDSIDNVMDAAIEFKQKNVSVKLLLFLALIWKLASLINKAVGRTFLCGSSTVG